MIQLSVNTERFEWQYNANKNVNMNGCLPGRSQKLSMLH